MIFESFPVGRLQCNCSIVGDEATREAMVIDPGDNIPDILARLKKHGLKETEAGITMKLKRGTFSAVFMLACVAALELEQVVLEEI